MGNENPYYDWSRAVGSKNYMGSSGYWGDLGTNQLANTYRTGMGYTGDLSKGLVALKSGVQPSWSQQEALNRAGISTNKTYATSNSGAKTWGTGTTSSSAATGSTTKSGNAADDWETVSVVKNPTLNTGVKDLYSNYSSGLGKASTLFDTNLSKWSAKYPSSIENAYTKGLSYLDPEKTGATLRGLDTAYKTGLEGEMGGYRQSNALATQQQNAALANQRALVSQYINQLLPQANRLSLGAANLAATRSMLGAGIPGASSDVLSQSQNSYWSRYMPYLQDYLTRANAVEGTAMDLANQQAAREASRYGYDASALGNIYGAQAGTEKYLNTLGSQYGQQVANQANAVLSAYQQPLAAQAQSLGYRTSALGNIGQLDEAANYRGLSYKPGAEISQVAGAAYPVYNSGGYSGLGGGSRFGGGGYGYGGYYGGAQPAQSAMSAQFQGPQMEQASIDPNTGGYRYRGLQVRDNRNPGYWYGGRAQSAQSANYGSESPGNWYRDYMQAVGY